MKSPKGFGQGNATYKNKIIYKAKNIENLKKKAAIFLSKSQYKKVEVIYLKLIEQGVKDSVIFNDLCKIYLKQGKIKNAIKILKIYTKFNPRIPSLLSNLGHLLKDIGSYVESINYLESALEVEPNNHKDLVALAFCYQEVGDLNKAKVINQKLIEIDSNCAIHLNNMGVIHEKMGNLQKAKNFFQQALSKNPNLAQSIFSLTQLIDISKEQEWEKRLFSEDILKNQSNINLVCLYKARSNLLHKRKNYEKSGQYLKVANNIRKNIYPYTITEITDKSKILEAKSNQLKHKEMKTKTSKMYIFIVGMPRSGSTLIESIINMNKEIYALGETNILEESFIEWENSNCHRQISSLEDLYQFNINKLTNKPDITTNKWLYNYQYAGIIANQITNSKIIHCYRNPLDNILSLYRVHFDKGHNYASSLIDCAKVYIDQDNIMSKYKEKYRSQIYSLNYDKLVKNPRKVIKDLIRWISFDWKDSYLSPHLSNRSVLTASRLQVRQPIYTKSSGGWKNYRTILRPAIEIITNNVKYKDLINEI